MTVTNNQGIHAPTTVYVVTEGDYSDYHICGVYSTHQLADIAVKINGGYVSLWTLDEHADVLRSGLSGWFIAMEGDIVTECLKVSSIDPLDSEFNAVYKDRSQDFAYYRVSVRAFTEDQARKIGQDLIVEYRAKEEGVA